MSAFMDSYDALVASARKLLVEHKCCTQTEADGLSRANAIAELYHLISAAHKYSTSPN